MCQDCGRIFCANMCPGYEGHSAERGRPRGTCGLCGQSLYRNDRIYRHERQILCENCHEGVRTDSQGVSESIEFQSLPFGIDL